MMIEKLQKIIRWLRSKFFIFLQVTIRLVVKIGNFGKYLNDFQDLIDKMENQDNEDNKQDRSER